jgi:hypothetical protein
MAEEESSSNVRSSAAQEAVISSNVIKRFQIGKVDMWPICRAAASSNAAREPNTVSDEFFREENVQLNAAQTLIIVQLNEAVLEEPQLLIGRGRVINTRRLIHNSSTAAAHNPR